MALPLLRRGHGRKGQRLSEQTGPVPLRTVYTATLPSGVLHVRYAPA